MFNKSKLPTKFIYEVKRNKVFSVSDYRIVGHMYSVADVVVADLFNFLKGLFHLSHQNKLFVILNISL